MDRVSNACRFIQGSGCLPLRAESLEQNMPGMNAFLYSVSNGSEVWGRDVLVGASEGK